ncbi:signal peptidase II [Luminiphilus syltensis NOR5-1B]|uniref:Lipoprotein signal peptidase n=1 Tax=Luminiphilus syltensis NOR5-1B TaxID=565045 RepID=B8KX12_9GAMM|nr:signal peptidase II [Luminiphilus syltensis NOR5-1B]
MREAGWRSRQALLGYGCAVLVLLLDQWSKNIASEALDYRTPVELTDWFSLTLAHNTGAAFSFLADAGGWQRWFFSAVACVVSGVVVFWLGRLERGKLWHALALGLILGGGLGNFYDRVLLGYVVDFISLHYGDWYWPAFNVADSAISAGAVVLILDSLVGSDRTSNEAR